MYETEKYRHLVIPFLRGNIIDLGSGGCPIVPRAIQVELPQEEFAKYTSGSNPQVEPQWRGDAFNLPFKDGTVDTVYSSHLLEDVENWGPVLAEWIRVIKPGGRLVIMLPDKTRWQAALKRGQPPNCAHRHESEPGELSRWCNPRGIITISDGLTNLTPEDYNILFVGIKR